MKVKAFKTEDRCYTNAELFLILEAQEHILTLMIFTWVPGF